MRRSGSACSPSTWRSSLAASLAVVLAAAFVSVLLLITFDLDRPVRGLVTVPTRRSSASAPRWSSRLAADGPNGP